MKDLRHTIEQPGPRLLVIGVRRHRRLVVEPVRERTVGREHDRVLVPRPVPHQRSLLGLRPPRVEREERQLIRVVIKNQIQHRQRTTHPPYARHVRQPPNHLVNDIALFNLQKPALIYRRPYPVIAPRSSFNCAMRLFIGCPCATGKSL